VDWPYRNFFSFRPAMKLINLFLDPTKYRLSDIITRLSCVVDIQIPSLIERVSVTVTF
jgi:hypothetical protein